ncbi:hypothetical protein SBF1_840053 [Candidatus Desulfosporosinus infrequens]|uniref:Transposase n=1 Tax=Candidatus Desulfosporosinus infrequens TaxID=2043169 RepID=A0A2U3LUQ7_9FIRM|nr:hypothetical protein SBF1_840053 [Candidatus Desulfosporosinus infrequens]
MYTVKRLKIFKNEVSNPHLYDIIYKVLVIILDRGQRLMHEYPTTV